MIYEMVLGRGQLSGKSKPVLTILKYKNDIESAYQCLTKAGTDRFMKEVMITIPRYARINTLLTTMPDVLDDLKKSGYYHKEYQEDISEDAYLEKVKNLKPGEFLIDYHFKDLLVFPCKENLRTWDLYNQGHIFLQDKSSCIPVCVLSPQRGSNVVDACAAPGMKTAHIAAVMKNQGQIFAYEKDSDRLDILKSTLIHGNVKICKTYCKDFRTVDPADDKNSNIDYILLDPTCSGSGMVNRMDAATDTENSKNEKRLQKLAGFQIVLLKHALKFPNVKRVVYSTCSITEEENEYVVHEALNSFQDQFTLVNIMPDWSVRGSPKYEYGNLCLRSYPDKNLTNGFFVAMFERTELNKVSNSNTLIKMSKHKKNKSKRKIDSENDDFLSSNSQKQFKNNNWSETNAGDVNSEQKEEVQSETVIKKKLTKKHKIKTDIQYKTSNNEKKNFCEEGDFTLPVLQEELQRNNSITNNLGNLNLEKTKGTHQSECHMKKKHKKKKSFGKTAGGEEKNNFVKNENGDDFHSCTSQKQYYRNKNNVNLEQMEKTEIHQSEIHVKKKCKKKAQI
ncbi:28S rRNA (cytosine-C(5))-methyltransferase-like [Stegodyphus dumicola]|uniref:28S rRNA (cytosine-C(5))-methyltransferase-like n=1 Tax=Stegodyphus dumicola TaxID=202533 RepID=UPI0015AE602A|nr:28S rRNA (cytosine-C(5))-methyltransferase-like [Stegodyphus dumicola]